MKLLTGVSLRTSVESQYSKPLRLWLQEEDSGGLIALVIVYTPLCVIISYIDHDSAMQHCASFVMLASSPCLFHSMLILI